MSLAVEIVCVKCRKETVVTVEYQTGDLEDFKREAIKGLAKLGWERIGLQAFLCPQKHEVAVTI